MWRYLVGAIAAMLLMAGGTAWYRSFAARTTTGLPSAPAAAGAEATASLAEPPAASERTREEKRFARYDRDRNGIVARDEYLLARRKAFAKLDLNGDGKLSFDEYAAKATAKFAKADADRSGALDATEFATTRVVRKARAGCPPATSKAAPDDDAQAGEN